MIVPAWGGARSRRLVRLCLAVKGTTCHLCGEPGADSADHDPPRSQLIRLGVPDPDLIEWLWPAHLACNLWRRDRLLDDALLAEAREARAARMGRAPNATDARRSPALSARRPPRAF